MTRRDGNDDHSTPCTGHEQSTPQHQEQQLNRREEKRKERHGEKDHEAKGEERPIGWSDMNIPVFLITGAGISVACDLALYPFDVVKTRMQASGKHAAAYPPYRGTLHALRTMGKMEGRRGLYRGFSITAFGYLPSDILYYSAYEYGKHTLTTAYTSMHDNIPSLPETESIEPLIHLGMGGVAEMLSSSVWMPVDIVAQKLMVQGPLKKSKYSSPIDCIRKIHRGDGIRGFYRGFLATMITYSAQSAVSWGVYEFIRKRCYRHYPSEGLAFHVHSLGHAAGIVDTIPAASSEPVQKQDWLIHIMCGTVAGAVAAVTTNPIDVIKTRLQIQDYHSKDATSPSERPLYTKIRTMGSAIWREEGAAAFMKGGMARVAYLAPVSAMTFFTYEVLKQFAKLPDEPD